MAQAIVRRRTESPVSSSQSSEKPSEAQYAVMLKGSFVLKTCQKPAVQVEGTWSHCESQGPVQPVEKFLFAIKESVDGRLPGRLKALVQQDSDEGTMKRRQDILSMICRGISGCYSGKFEIRVRDPDSGKTRNYCIKEEIALVFARCDSTLDPESGDYLKVKVRGRGKNKLGKFRLKGSLNLATSEFTTMKL